MRQCRKTIPLPAPSRLCLHILPKPTSKPGRDSSHHLGSLHPPGFFLFYNAFIAINCLIVCSDTSGRVIPEQTFEQMLDYSTRMWAPTDQVLPCPACGPHAVHKATSRMEFPPGNSYLVSYFHPHFHCLMSLFRSSC